MADQERGYRKTRVGTVVSDKMDKTVVVAIKTKKKHPLYGKMVNYTNKLKAHDENNECGVGDTVRIMDDEYGFPVYSVVDVYDIIEYLEEDEANRENVERIKKYLEVNGAKA